MKYLHYTHVDFRTRRSVADFPAKNGPDYPNVPGLQFDFALETKYPSNVPSLYGTCDDTYNHETNPVWGVFETLTLEQYNEVKNKELEDRKPIVLKQIDATRDQLLAAGFPFTFSDGQGTVQTRDKNDMDNIHKNGSASLALVVKGEGTTMMQFRDAENVIHTIPATEMLEMTMSAMAHGSEVYKASWTHKDNVNNISSLNDLVNYSIHSDWPILTPPSGE